jgi:hypothetical protein
MKSVKQVMLYVAYGLTFVNGVVAMATEYGLWASG